MENQKRNNLVMIVLVAIVAVLATLLVLLLTGVINLGSESEGNINSVENTENNNITTNDISYKIVDDNTDEVLSLKKMYVDDKLVNFDGKASRIEVKQLNDILIVETSLASSTLYAVDKDANIIGVFTPSDNDYYKETNILPTRYYYRDTYRIDGNNLYVETDRLAQDPRYLLCNMVTNDDEVVIYEEKFEYLGNNKFSVPTVTKKVTRKQYMQEHNITCN